MIYPSVCNCELPLSESVTFENAFHIECSYILWHLLQCDRLGRCFMTSLFMTEIFMLWFQVTEQSLKRISLIPFFPQLNGIHCIHEYSRGL